MSGAAGSLVFDALRCSQCAAPPKARVTDGAPTETGYRRRRRCPSCGEQWWTQEVREESLQQVADLQRAYQDLQDQRRNELLAAVRALGDYALDGSPEHLAAVFLRARLEELERQRSA